MSKRNSISAIAIFIIFILTGCAGGSATVTQEVNHKQLHSDLNFNGVTYTKQDFKTEFTGLYLNKNTSLTANHLETATRVLKNKNGQPLNTLDSVQVIKFLSIANALIEMQYGSNYL
ncbi:MULTISPECIES: hypothetical protein [unclassified Pseudoalteromonas]|uniref:hypothetical protein n=1 Tax=unclassified Pseudoalteromonas TaxID=194690 RepID=UPI0005AAD790|nr:MULTISPECIES: hypothetical protein [unclassified Pseudoalteromonas]